MKRSVDKEQFYTAPALAERCVQFTDKLLGLDNFSCIVEPSAGDGVFLDLLPSDRRVGLDLDPRAPGVHRVDFLGWVPPILAESVLTIGNPPFGQRAALAVAFVKKACEFSDAVAFILPRSFNKYTFQNRVPVNFHLVDSFDCDDFLQPDGSRYPVQAVFQVWERRDAARSLVVLPDSHADFDMTHCHLSRTSDERLVRVRQEYQFAIAQVGSDFRPRDPETVSKGSYWFIRPHVPGVRERFAQLDFAYLDGMNTAHKSLSKRDIIAAYEASTRG